MSASLAYSGDGAYAYSPTEWLPAMQRSSDRPQPARHLSDWLEVDPVPILLVGPGGSLLEANRSGLKSLEAGSAAALRGDAICFVDQQANQRFANALASIMARRVFSVRLILRGNDGLWRRVEILGGGLGVHDRAYVRFPTEAQAKGDIAPLIEAFGISMPEAEVLRQLIDGLAPKEIARALSMSTNTVRSHLRTLYLKMNVRGIPGLIRQAVRLTR